jgi:hypothetical protein
VDGINSLVIKQRNRSLMESNRQRATKRKFKILLHVLVSRKVMPLSLLSITSFSGWIVDLCPYNFSVVQVIWRKIGPRNGLWKPVWGTYKLLDFCKNVCGDQWCEQYLGSCVCVNTWLTL